MDNKRTGKQIHGHKLRCDYILHVVCMCVAIRAVLPVFVHVHTLTCRHTALFRFMSRLAGNLSAQRL